MIKKRKAFAYITKGDKLLVFRHLEYPQAGIQVPAGTMRDDERPEEAVLREAYEETGLSNLKLVELLGVDERDMSDFGRNEIHQRYFYHLRYDGEGPANWQHTEDDPSEGEKRPIPFELFWVQLPDGVPELIAGHAKMLDKLLERMARSKEE